MLLSWCKAVANSELAHHFSPYSRGATGDSPNYCKETGEPPCPIIDGIWLTCNVKAIFHNPFLKNVASLPLFGRDPLRHRCNLAVPRNEAGRSCRHVASSARGPPSTCAPFAQNWWVALWTPKMVAGVCFENTKRDISKDAQPFERAKRLAFGAPLRHSSDRAGRLNFNKSRAGWRHSKDPQSHRGTYTFVRKWDRSLFRLVFWGSLLLHTVTHTHTARHVGGFSGLHTVDRTRSVAPRNETTGMKLAGLLVLNETRGMKLAGLLVLNETRGMKLPWHLRRGIYSPWRNGLGLAPRSGRPPGRPPKARAGS